MSLTTLLAARPSASVCVVKHGGLCLHLRAVLQAIWSLALFSQLALCSHTTSGIKTAAKISSFSCELFLFKRVLRQCHQLNRLFG